MKGDTTHVSKHTFADDGRFPNSALPLLIYGAAISEEVSPHALEALFAHNGWPPEWRYTVFDYHHYHSTTHEVLGVAAGTARLKFGGPQGETFEVGPGDVVVIPAGVAHKRDDSSPDFLVVGAYPAGAPDRDMLRGDPGDREKALANIPKVPIPGTDPVATDGPLLGSWGAVIP